MRSSKVIYSGLVATGIISRLLLINFICSLYFWDRQIIVVMQIVYGRAGVIHRGFSLGLSILLPHDLLLLVRDVWSPFPFRAPFLLPVVAVSFSRQGEYRRREPSVAPGAELRS